MKNLFEAISSLTSLNEDIEKEIECAENSDLRKTFEEISCNISYVKKLLENINHE